MMIKSFTSPTFPALEDELRQLYLRRVAIERLIQSLEQYHQTFAEVPPLKAAVPQMQSLMFRGVVS